MIAAMLPWSAFAPHRHLRSVRWSLCAREICFKNTILRCTRTASDFPRAFDGRPCTISNSYMPQKQALPHHLKIRAEVS